jgi:hypothetical protein
MGLGEMGLGEMVLGEMVLGDMDIHHTWHATCVQFACLKKVKVEPALRTLRWLSHNDVRPTKSHKWHRVFGELGALPKIREEIVSELQMGFRIFPFYVSVVDGSCQYVVKH